MKWALDDLCVFQHWEPNPYALGMYSKEEVLDYIGSYNFTLCTPPFHGHEDH